MEVPQYTQILRKRLQKIEVEPETATKIIGYLLLNHTPEEIIEYAVGPDKGIHALIKEAKAFLSFPHKHIPSSPVPSRIDRPIPNQYMPIQQSISRTFSSPSSLRVPVPSPLWDTHLAAKQQRIQTNIELAHPPFTDLVGDDWWLHNQSELLGLEDQLNPSNYLPPKFSSNYQYQDATLAGGLIPVTKACHYFYKGYCRHGTNCRFSHGPMTDSFSDVYGMGMNDLANDDHFFAPGSLEKLEMEIKELLIMRNGVPVSIASLPMLYQEKFGRPLQADGYLSESQRHGKTGYSLTKLLARLKNSIRLIDRPHGQHSVVLLEDASKYMDYRNERSDLLQAATSSCQIYLTFPADSTFTEEDVLDYFRQFGPVRDVRIPRQEKRMFGFVSFLFPDTVRVIFSKGHPHFICGSRVLVKPYKEKPKLNDRKHAEKPEHPICHPSPFIETDLDSNTTPRLCNSSRLLTKQLIEEMIELESSHICELQLTPKNPTQHPFIGQNIEGMRFSQDIINCPRLLLNKNTTSDDKFKQASNNYNDQDSDRIELPDSPFASQ